MPHHDAAIHSATEGQLCLCKLGMDFLLVKCYKIVLHKDKARSGLRQHPNRRWIRPSLCKDGHRRCQPQLGGPADQRQCASCRCTASTCSTVYSRIILTGVPKDSLPKRKIPGYVSLPSRACKAGIMGTLFKGVNGKIELLRPSAERLRLISCAGQAQAHPSVYVHGMSTAGTQHRATRSPRSAEHDDSLRHAWHSQI